MSNRPIELSIIMPAFNEAEEIQASIRTVDKKMAAMKAVYEIIVVNDGSRDETLTKAQACACGHIQILSYGQNRGKGFAVRHGMLHSKGKYKLFMDVDLSTSLDAIDQFLMSMHEDKYDVLIGNRKNGPGSTGTGQPWHRRFLGTGYIKLSCLCAGTNIKDFTCGFKMFNAKAADIIFTRQRTFDWSFDTELIYIAILHRLRIGEMGVVWKHHHGSTVRPLRDILISLAGLLKIRWHIFKKDYR
ncbi:MAG: glycosyltransferase [Candidatus Omnitrophica bacterium]|nr:glycosyltransferase [Candidatus Omnitrophota bacterium]